MHPPDDFSHHTIVQANWPLTAETVFDYFATSMFDDKKSNKQVLRMQTMQTGIPITNDSRGLKRIQYIEAIPPLVQQYL